MEKKIRINITSEEGHTVKELAPSEVKDFLTEQKNEGRWVFNKNLNFVDPEDLDIDNLEDEYTATFRIAGGAQ